MIKLIIGILIGICIGIFLDEISNAREMSE